MMELMVDLMRSVCVFSDAFSRAFSRLLFFLRKCWPQTPEFLVSMTVWAVAPEVFILNWTDPVELDLTIFKTQTDCSMLFVCISCSSIPTTK